MSKNAFFIGQPIFSQIIKLIPRWIIDQAVIDFSSDRYVKKFKTYDHYNSLNEFTYAMYSHLPVQDKQITNNIFLTRVCRIC